MIVAMRYFIALIVLGWTITAQAIVVAIDHTGGSPPIFGEAQVTAGWEFSVTSPVTVDALGFFDFGPAGLAMSHDVGLWTSTGDLLAQVTVNNSSTPVDSTSEWGDWLFEPIGAVVLEPGNYVIGALFESPADSLVFRAMATSYAAGVAFLGARFTLSSELAFPDTPDPGANAGYFGPTFSVLQQEAPEPASIALLGIALAGLGLGRRRLTK